MGTILSIPEAAIAMDLGGSTVRRYLAKCPEAMARDPRLSGGQCVDAQVLRDFMAERHPHRYAGLKVDTDRLELLRAAGEVLRKPTDNQVVADDNQERTTDDQVTTTPVIPRTSDNQVETGDCQDPQERDSFLILRDAYQDRGELVKRLDREVAEARQEVRRRVRRWQVVALVFLVMTGTAGVVAGWVYGEMVGGQAELATRVEQVGQLQAAIDLARADLMAERDRADVAYADLATERERMQDQPEVIEVAGWWPWEWINKGNLP